MGRYSGKTCRLLSMLSLTAGYFFVEITVGYMTNSLALVGDSYHMLSDVIALLVGYASVRISRWQSKKNTYGWARAEVLGALVNSVFLVALCFTIFVEALQRMAHDEHIKDPKLMLIVGALGLAINLIGLCLFSGHGHSHGGGGGHGHSHGGGGHGHSHGGHDSHSHGGHGHEVEHSGDAHSHEPYELTNLKVTQANNGVLSNHVIDSDDEGDKIDDQLNGITIDEDGHQTKTKMASSAQLNMRGVFLHVLGDALGSVVVIVSALVIMFVEDDWKYKVDPAMSMFMVVLIMSTTLPLLKESALILLQTVPTHLRVHELREKLLQVKGVIAVHEFHIWQLAGNRIIASAHISCQNLADYVCIADKVKIFFHNEGIHSTTIQPEFIELEQIPLRAGFDCALECPDKLCLSNTCCGTKKASKDSKLVDVPPTEGDTAPDDAPCHDDHANAHHDHAHAHHDHAHAHHDHDHDHAHDARGGGDSQAVTGSAVVLNLESA